MKIGGTWNTALNTKVFAKVWHRVFDDKLFEESDWTVKVDPDAVFLPWRLREHLLGARPQEEVFLNNCRAGLHGPIEVVSRGGMEVASPSGTRSTTGAPCVSRSAPARVVAQKAPNVSLP